MRILVTGSNGQLGSELQRIAPAYPRIEFVFVDRNILPLHDANAIGPFFEREQFDYCINCAAFTAVDKAEQEAEQAFLINATAVEHLARACEKQHCRLLQISTDYVFDGTATEPIKEDAPVRPLGVYGKSKAAGEIAATENNPGCLIIRTSWVYSSYGNNFVKTMLRLMSDRDTVKVVNDQFGSPTYAYDMAKALIAIICSPASRPDQPGGIFHYANEGTISWYDFARAIKEAGGKQCDVMPIPSAAYPTPAQRPKYSVFETGKIRAVFGIVPPPWKDSLQLCMAEMQQLLA